MTYFSPYLYRWGKHGPSVHEFLKNAPIAQATAGKESKSHPRQSPAGVAPIGD
jgi:hypothetical protein